MNIFILLLTLQAAIGECVPPEPNHPKSPVGASAPSLGMVSLEIPLLGPIAEPKEIIDVLTARNIQATLLVTYDWAIRHSDFLKSAADRGHEIGVWLSLKDDVGMAGEYAKEPDLADWVAALRRARKEIRRTTSQTARTVGMAVTPPLGETAAEALAFRAVLPNERTVGDLPRRVEKIDKTKGRARVLGQGRYEDGCGHILPHWSPAGLDRATHAAARADWIRIGLPSAEGVGPMLSQWLDKVVIPQKWTVVTAKRMAKEAQKWEDKPSREAPQIAVAKRVSAETLLSAATALADATALPQYPAQDLNLTETFYGLVTLSTSEVSAPTVTLGHLSPPTEGANRELKSNVQFSRDQVAEMAQMLGARLRGQVPSIISIGGHSITAAEALQLLARYILEKPLLSTPVSNPMPYSPDCGWGSSVGL